MANGATREPRDVVVGFDGSAASRLALVWALDEAEVLGCQVWVLAAWRMDAPGAAARPLSEVERAGLRRDFQRAVAEVFGDRAGPVLRTELVSGDPVEVLVAASGRARLLVLGSHGHNRLPTTALGSVTAYCVRHATCPVVVIPARVVARDEEDDGVLAPVVAHPAVGGLGPVDRRPFGMPNAPVAP